MDVNCELEYQTFLNGQKYYTCLIQRQFIRENVKLNMIRTRDTLLKADSAVEAVIFRDCQVSKVPQGLTKIYPNLKILHIVRSGLEVVTKADLVEYRNLENIALMNNLINFMPNDLFKGFMNLKFLQMCGNDVDIIEPNILDGLYGLEVADFRDEKRFFKCHSFHPLYPSNGNLDDVKNEIFTKYYKDYKKSGNLFQFEDENRMLRSSNDILTQKVKKQEKQIEELQQKLARLEKVQKIFNTQKKLESVSPSKKDIDELPGIPINVIMDIKNLLQSDESFKDLKITIEDRVFSVHKILVAARIPTLTEILQNNPSVENINLVDISAETFEVILKFLYKNEFPNDKKTNFVHLFGAAGKLRIDELREFAASKLVNIIDERNAVEVYKLSSSYGGSDLIQKSFTMIKNIYSEIPIEHFVPTDSDFVIKLILAFHNKEEIIRKTQEEYEKLIKETLIAKESNNSFKIIY